MKPFIVSVNAVSGGGKTSVVKALQKKLPNSYALFFDDGEYDVKSGIEDICRWAEDGSDVHAFNLDSLADEIEKLKKQKPDYIILDYPFGYRHKKIAPFINLSIYLDTPLDVAMSRRFLRDYDCNSAQAMLDDLKHYLERGRAVYFSGIEEAKKAADLVVDGSLSIEELVTQIVDEVTSKS